MRAQPLCVSAGQSAGEGWLERQEVTAAVAAQGLKAQTQSVMAASLQLASGLSKRVFYQNTDIKPIIRWGLLSVFLYAFREKKDPINKTVPFSAVLLSTDQMVLFSLPSCVFLC